MPRTLPARIAAKIRTDAGGDGCWMWTARRNASGYGEVRSDGYARLAHRVVYELLTGPIPDGLTLDHLCRTPACVNPAHLEPVTNAENILRGESPAAIHARQTHCLRGHRFDSANTRIQKRAKGWMRVCRTCHRDKERERYRRRHAA